MGIGWGPSRLVKGKCLTLQSYDKSGAWRDLDAIGREGLMVGRSTFVRGMSAPEFVAIEHLKISNENDHLFVEERATINGYYMRVAPGAPAELVAGSRFQVGHHVIEFRLPGPVAPPSPLVAPGGEVFWGRPIVPLAFLDFIGPDNRPALSFPLTKLEGTVLGREGEYCDIALTGDEWASRSHARIVRRDERYYLEDLHSTNGTFIRISGRTPLRYGRANDPASSDVLLIGAILIRVEEQ